MTYLDPRNIHSHAIGWVHKTNDPSSYVALRLTSNAVAMVTAVAALGTQILVCAAKGIAGPIGKLVHYENAPSWEEWVYTAKKVLTYIQGAFYTVFALTATLFTTSVSRANVAYQFTQGLVDDKFIKDDSYQIQNVAEDILNHVRDVQQLMESLRNSLDQFKLPLVSTEITREYLLALLNKIEEASHIEAQVKEIANHDRLDHIQWEKRKAFLSAQARKETWEAITTIKKDIRQAQALVADVSKRHDDFNLEYKKSINSIFVTLANLSMQATKKFEVLEKACDAFFTALEHVGECFRIRDLVTAMKQMDKISLDLQNLASDTMERHQVSNKFILHSAWLATPVWETLDNNSVQHVQEMSLVFDALKALNEQILWVQDMLNEARDIHTQLKSAEGIFSSNEEENLKLNQKNFKIITSFIGRIREHINTTYDADDKSSQKSNADEDDASSSVTSSSSGDESEDDEDGFVDDKVTK